MPIPGLGAVEQIAKAISEGSKLVAQIIGGHAVRKLKYRMEAAMSYVHVSEKEGEYADISDKRQKELKLHFRKRIFDE